MKKTLMATAVAAALVAPMASQAVNVSPDGLGQVLLFPYYNADDGNVTFIGVTNTTNQTKVLKVRFREGMESEDVLDFQLWLSPYDNWTASVQQENGQITVATSDNSCLSPNSVMTSHTPFSTANISPRFTGNLLNRLAEGHVEIFEESTVTGSGSSSNSLKVATTHGSNGVPANCATVDAFNTQMVPIITSGTVTNSLTGVSGTFGAPTGGVYGLAAVFNPTSGVWFPYSAEALNHFADGGPLFFPQFGAILSKNNPMIDPRTGGNYVINGVTMFGPLLTADFSHIAGDAVNQLDLPDLSTPDAWDLNATQPTGASATISAAAGNLTQIYSQVYQGAWNVPVDGTGAAAGDGFQSAVRVGTFTVAADDSDAATKKRDAVASVLQAGEVYNDFLSGDAYNTDWVFTFPGRYLYQKDPAFSSPVDPPFTRLVDQTSGQACEPVSALFHDREEKLLSGVQVSPGIGFSLCYEVNVIAFNDSAPAGSATSALGSIALRADSTVGADFGTGQLRMTQTFSDDAAAANGPAAAAGKSTAAATVFRGLPFIGFSAITTTSNGVERGGVFQHKITRGE